VVTLTADGHPDVSARHGKTLELTAETAIGAAATCVVGVSVGPLPGELPRLRGRVRLVLAAGGLTATVDGEVNPYYASAERLVVRRSDVLDPDTFLVNASAAAADLDRALVERLRDPAARLEVTATEIGTPDPVLLVLLVGGSAALAPPPQVVALAAQADRVVDLTGPGAPAPPLTLPDRRRHGVPDPALLAGARTVVVLARDLDELTAGSPARTALAEALPGARAMVWPAPTSAADLLLAAGAATSPVLHAGALPASPARRRDLAATLAAVPAAGAVTVTGPERGQELASALAELRERLPGHALLLPDPTPGWGVGAIAPPPGEPLDPPLLRGLRRSPTLALLPSAGRATTLTVEPGELAGLLRTAGVSGRDAAGVLTALGVPRRDAYRAAAEQP